MNRRQFIQKSVVGAATASRIGSESLSAMPHSLTPTENPEFVERYSGLTRPDVINLGGSWRFREDPGEVGEASEWFHPGRVTGRESPVPVPWQLAFEDLKDYSGTAWYERRFHLSPDASTQRVAIVFEAVDHAAKVWVNGQLAGEHEGGQTPFLFDITRLVRGGDENTVTVKMTDPAEGMSFFMDTHSLINVSGIWRDAWIETTGHLHVADMFIIPDIDHSKVLTKIEVAAPPLEAPLNLQLRLVVRAPDGEEFTTEAPLNLSKSNHPSFLSLDLSVRLSKTLQWEIDSPQLYQARISVADENGTPVDSASSDFGMRKIETRGDRIYLNNRPLYIVGGGLDPGPYGGANDINWHLPPPYTLPTDEQIQKDIHTAKSFGVNFVRVPLRPASPRFLYWADRLGILVMQGGPWTPTEGIKAQVGFEKYREWWTEIVLRDRNHPSLALWELFNEGFGMTWDAFKNMAGENSTITSRIWIRLDLSWTTRGVGPSTN